MSKLFEYKIGGPIGTGRFGNVYLARKKGTQKDVAIKVINKSQLKREKLEHQIDREIEILSLVNHENIIQMIDHFEDEDRIYIVTNYAEGGELYQKLKQAKLLSEYTVGKYIFQLSDAVSYLHQLNIIHRDIKPENILLTSNDDILLCDFGWSVRSETRRTTICGTVDYMCPEIIDSEPYDYRCDLWNIGVLTYELLVGQPPFYSRKYRDTYLKISKVDVKYPTYLSPGSIDFMSCLLVRKPEDRMEADKIKNHEWIITHSNQ